MKLIREAFDMLYGVVRLILDPNDRESALKHLDSLTQLMETHGLGPNSPAMQGPATKSQGGKR